MDIVEAVRNRNSVRAFKPDPVPLKILREIMEVALYAPSWANTQPWEFAIVTGQKLDRIKQAFIEKADEPTYPDIVAPREFPEPYDSRRRALGKKFLEIRGIGREDKEGRRRWRQWGLGMFGATTVIYILIDRSFYFQGDHLNAWSIFDCGMIAENIMLLATTYGLGTIPEIQAVAYPDILRKVLGIPDSKLIVLGIAIGYPDWNDPINQFRTERESLDKITKWYGFTEK